MTKTLPEPFPPIAPVVASFDFNDLASGLSYQTFEGFMAKAASTTPGLTTNTFPSAVVDTVQTNAGNQTLTFDSSTFNATRTIKGTAYFSVGTQCDAGAGNGHIWAQVSKWDGTTQTDITASGAIVLIGTAFETVLMGLDTTQTTIAAGEQLRLVVNIQNDVSAGTTVAIGHDPANGAGSIINPVSGASTAQMRLFMPFRNDLG